MAKKYRAATLIRERLMHNALLFSKVKGKIFPCIAPEDTPGDYIIVYRKAYGKSRTKQGEYETYCSVGVEIYSDDYDRSIDIAELVDEALDVEEQVVWLGGDVCIELAGSIEDYVDGKYLQELEFEIKD